MIPVLIAVALGVLIGHFNLVSFSQKVITNFTTLCLFIMLFAMGAQLGANEKLLADLGHMGWQALVLALGSILGSVLLVRLMETRISERINATKPREIPHRPKDVIQ